MLDGQTTQIIKKIIIMDMTWCTIKVTEHLIDGKVNYLIGAQNLRTKKETKLEKVCILCKKELKKEDAITMVN